MPRYFEVLDDLTVPGRWALKAPTGPGGEPILPATFTDGKVASVSGGVVVERRAPGSPLDFTFAAFDVPVVSDRIAPMLVEVAASRIQLIPTKLAGVPGTYSVLNVIGLKPLDESKSEILRWRAGESPFRKEGEYRMVTKIVLDSARTDDAPIFRIAGWQIALIVSAELRGRLVSLGTSGIKFGELEVT